MLTYHEETNRPRAALTAGAMAQEATAPMHEDRIAIPDGYCRCGCGQQTGVWALTHRPKGRVKGQHKRYVHGHHRRGLVSRQEPLKWLPEDRGFLTPCWIWQLDISKDGYGRKWLGQRRVHAHRWTYEQVRGPIPDGLQLDHLCRVRDCVNPEHLEPVTPRENTRRGIEARRHAQ